MNTVAIIDYGMCNLDSVRRAVEECGGDPIVTDQASDIEKANRIILPGVGAFPDAMQNIKARSLDQILSEQVIEQQIPLLGICLGMQLLAFKSWEVRECEGLGWIDGEVVRLQPTAQDRRIPHVGWNDVIYQRESPLFRGIPSGKDFYMVHSYHLACRNPEDTVACTPYCGGFTSAVQRDWIFGVQFHPEKSQKVGFQVLKNFLAI
ncbi:MAG: imidazole glycerol phosphate synthase subunit HisH [Caldilineaceae bacterium]|nr:imidazole glycerol phosphate synthase subunit HisH [Caldilineaceae bacterium]